ncbi:MAG: cupin domain-containing protein [Candidatus Bathyarchaeia archaeon]
MSVKELIEYPREGILSKELVKTGESNITLFCMSGGTEISEHTSTREGFLIVLEGKGTFNLEGEAVSMKPGTFIFIERNAVHSLKADENTAFILLLCGSK